MSMTIHPEKTAKIETAAAMNEAAENLRQAMSRAKEVAENVAAYDRTADDRQPDLTAAETAMNEARQVLREAMSRATDELLNFEPVQIHQLEFAASAPDLGKAGVLLREAIGQVKSLSDSLVGLHPGCAEALNLDLRWHRDVRKFRDEEGLRVYKDYLQGLMEQATALAHKCECGVPVLRNFDRGFSYVVGSGRCGIALSYSAADDEWQVLGFARFVNPDIAERNLKKKGFKVVETAQ